MTCSVAASCVIKEAGLLTIILALTHQFWGGFIEHFFFKELGW
jgi:hypothetical protein